MLGSKTMGAAYSKTKSSVRAFAAFIINLPRWTCTKIQEAGDYLALVKSKMKNFYKTNLDLGLYHLRLGNLNDAIMRLKIVDKFIAPHDSEANYWLGWAYFLKNNHSKALYHLQISHEKDADILKNFIKNYNSAIEIPRKIWKDYKDLTTHIEMQKAGEYVANLPQEFVQNLFETMQELPKECSMLDLGCSSGFIGAIIDRKLQKNYHLTGVDDREEMLENARRLREDKRCVYDELKCSSIEEFLQANGIKFDIVISFNTLNFSRNLEHYFKQIYGAIKAKGYFALMLLAGDETGWHPLKSEFIYSETDIAKQLKLAEFDLIGIKEWKLKGITRYITFICKK